MILKAGYLQRVGLVEEAPAYVHVRGVSILVSHPGQESCEINLKIRKPFPGTIGFAHCSCTGGSSGKCKHTVAVLRTLMASTVLEMWTCTDGPCSWETKMKATQEEILKPVRMTQFCHNMEDVSGTSLPTIPCFFQSEVFNVMFEKIPNDCAFKKDWNGRGTSKFVQKINQIRRTLVHFPNALELYDKNFENLTAEDLITKGRNLNFQVSQNDISKIEKATRGQASNPNWFKFKKGRITGSIIGEMMKMRSLTSNLTVLKKACYPANSKFSTPATRYGCQHEKDAVAAYCKLKEDHVNLQVTQRGLYINYDFPFIGASPDAYVKCDCCGDRVLEVKCPHCLTTGVKLADLKCLSPSAVPVNSISPTISTSNSTVCMLLDKNHNFYYQVQAEMLCAEVARADFMIWSATEEPHLETIERDENILTDIITRAEAYFYHTIIPELFAQYYTRQALLNPKPKRKKGTSTKEKKPGKKTATKSSKKRTYVRKKTEKTDAVLPVVLDRDLIKRRMGK